jgi:hypothetical protein
VQSLASPQWDGAVIAKGRRPSTSRTDAPDFANSVAEAPVVPILREIVGQQLRVSLLAQTLLYDVQASAPVS